VKPAARLLVPVCALVLIALGGCPARADDHDAANFMTANALFKRGKSLVDEGKYAEACPVLERAQQLVLGIGVTLYLADCYERTGRPVLAWEQFDKARQLAGSSHDGRASIARERAERLLPNLPRLLLVVPPGVDVPGLVLTEDGAFVDHAAYNTERPVAPGTHWLRAEAPDRAPWESSVEIAASAGTQRVEVPQLAPRDPAVVAMVTSTPSPSEAQPSAGPTPRLMEHSTQMPPQRVWGIAVAGVGAVSLAVSAVLGLQAKAQMDDSNSSGHCLPNDHCDATGLAERSDAITKGTWSTVTAIGGVACLAGGAFLYFTARDAPPGVALAARPQRGGGSLLLEGRW
jgi:hypothetical protein